ncbi:MAG TPA: hypothetical protein VGA04_05400 [Streptosporangiaceae bacterium]
MPGQQCSGRDEPVAPQYRREQPDQYGHDCPVGPVRLRPRDLTAQHCYLVPEHHDLRVLGRWLRPSSTSQPKTRIAIHAAHCATRRRIVRSGRPPPTPQCV